MLEVAERHANQPGVPMQFVLLYGSSYMRLLPKLFRAGRKVLAVTMQYTHRPASEPELQPLLQRSSLCKISVATSVRAGGQAKRWREEADNCLSVGLNLRRRGEPAARLT